MPRRLSFGFTLIELMVVITIMATLAVLLIPQYTHYNKTQTLQDSASNVVTALRTAQNNAASGIVCNQNPAVAPNNKADFWSVKFTGSGNFQVVANNCVDINGAPVATVIPTPAASYQIPLSKIQVEISLSDGGLPNTCTYSDINPTFVKFKNITAETSFDCPPHVDMTKYFIKFQVVGDATNKTCVIVERGGSIFTSSDPAVCI